MYIPIGSPFFKVVQFEQSHCKGACYTPKMAWFNLHIFVSAVTATGFCEIVFRLTNGQGVYQWVRGKARTLYDKNDKPECVTADNVLLK